MKRYLSVFIAVVTLMACGSRGFASQSASEDFKAIKEQVRTSAEELRRMLFREEARKMFVIRIPMKVGSQAEIVFPDGKVEACGEIKAIPERVRYPGFTASHYGRGAEVTASAVNAHHLAVDILQGQGRTISIVPSDTYVLAAGSGSSFVLEGTGGRGLWGRYAPFVGSPMYAILEDGQRVRFNKPEMLEQMVSLEIEVQRPEYRMDYIHIDNFEGGQAWYHDEQGAHPFGVVVRPVSGTGRFAGGLYQDAGYIRANHRGVICISTSPRTEVGGFQIIPLAHTDSREMHEALTKNQWLIIKGVDEREIRGAFPFFGEAIRPGDSSQKSATEGRVVCQMGDDPRWVNLPVVSSITEDTLQGVKAIRIILR